MYQDFCDRCGSAIDPKTGRCPDCARRGNRTAGLIVAVVLIAVVLAVTLFREPVVRGVTDLAHRVEALFSTRPEPEPDVVQAVEPAPDPRPEPDPARDEAVKAAQAYLETETYSPSALYLQLYGDGYQEADIDYALDHCGANWYENAAYCAMDWVASYYYSRGMLVEDLMNSGFTADEAAYGADYCGANWSDEATLYGAFLLEETPELSAEEVSAALLEFGYTEEEAQYAVDQLFDNAPAL